MIYCVQSNSIKYRATGNIFLTKINSSNTFVQFCVYVFVYVISFHIRCGTAFHSKSDTQLWVFSLVVCALWMFYKIQRKWCCVWFSSEGQKELQMPNPLKLRKQWHLVRDFKDVGVIFHLEVSKIEHIQRIHEIDHFLLTNLCQSQKTIIKIKLWIRYLNENFVLTPLSTIDLLLPDNLSNIMTPQKQKIAFSRLTLRLLHHFRPSTNKIYIVIIINCTQSVIIIMSYYYIFCNNNNEMTRN